MTHTVRNIEMAIPKKTLSDLLESHLYSISFANDNEDVEIEFKAKHLQGTSDTIPIAIKLSSRKEVKDNRDNGT